jgi:hypothetical protein
MPHELVRGSKYLAGLEPWGLVVVLYLGPSRWLPRTYSRVRNTITRREYSIRTDRLRPLLTEVNSRAR